MDSSDGYLYSEFPSAAFGQQPGIKISRPSENVESSRKGIQHYARDYDRWDDPCLVKTRIILEAPENFAQEGNSPQAMLGTIAAIAPN